MTIDCPTTTWTDETALLKHCHDLQGLSFAQLATLLKRPMPSEPKSRKGWLGQAVELALGANAGNQALPDFMHLGIELKTIPINLKGKAQESTFITSIPLLTIQNQEWKTSQCYLKLQRILWLPIEGEKGIPFFQRRIGKGFIWSPTSEEEQILEADWLLLTSMISLGQLEEIDASMGEYLQIRPKAMNARALCYGFNSEGIKIPTLPRGFYLRTKFTNKILAKSY